jgi:hypothetical protein
MSHHRTPDWFLLRERPSAVAAHVGSGRGLPREAQAVARPGLVGMLSLECAADLLRCLQRPLHRLTRTARTKTCSTEGWGVTALNTYVG